MMKRCFLIMLVFVVGFAWFSVPRLWAQGAPDMGSGAPFFMTSTRAYCFGGSEAKVATINNVFAGSGDKQLVAGVAGGATTNAKVIKVFAWDFMSSNAGVNIGFDEGTGTDCATGKTVLTDYIAQYSAANQTMSSGLPWVYAPMITNTTGDALCLKVSGATTITGSVRYCQE